MQFELLYLTLFSVVKKTTFLDFDQSTGQKWLKPSKIDYNHNYFCNSILLNIIYAYNNIWSLPNVPNKKQVDSSFCIKEKPYFL